MLHRRFNCRNLYSGNVRWQWRCIRYGQRFRRWFGSRYLRRRRRILWCGEEDLIFCQKLACRRLPNCISFERALAQCKCAAQVCPCFAESSVLTTFNSERHVCLLCRMCRCCKCCFCGCGHLGRRNSCVDRSRRLQLSFRDPRQARKPTSNLKQHPKHSASWLSPL